jgi:hypothetical protein
MHVTMILMLLFHPDHRSSGSGSAGRTLQRPNIWGLRVSIGAICYPGPAMVVASGPARRIQ